jgi:hypothetical protein
VVQLKSQPHVHDGVQNLANNFDGRGHGHDYVRGHVQLAPALQLPMQQAVIKEIEIIF